ncbi:MAG: aminotransferase class V-fold PLP-dependent enzyme [Kiritimatiellae bacterium]|nr:aminotransferase class V-fold PLP-dependent enzyme [Kiritimatiellia bacterium]
MKRCVYADHAATTPLIPEALEAMLPFMKGDFGNPSSIHSWARKPREAVREARATIADCIGAEPERRTWRRLSAWRRRSRRTARG